MVGASAQSSSSVPQLRRVRDRRLFGHSVSAAISSISASVETCENLSRNRFASGIDFE